MPQINISDSVYARVMAFKPVVESLLEVTLDPDAYAELLLRMGPDFIMGQTFGGADAKTLFALLQQLGQNHPDVYGAIAEILQRDEQAIEQQQRAEVKRTLGFPEPKE